MNKEKSVDFFVLDLEVDFLAFDEALLGKLKES
jgi:hypothetical protein